MTTDNAVTAVDRGPKAVAYQTIVNAPAAELFAMLANPHRHHEADGSGWVQPSVIGPRELQLGDRFRVSMKLMGKVPYAMTSTVVDVVPGRAIEWQHPGKHTWRWEFEPINDATTRVTEVFDYSDSPVPWLLQRARSIDANHKGIKASLRQLQRRYSCTQASLPGTSGRWARPRAVAPAEE